MFDLNNLCSLCLVHNKKFTSRNSIDSCAEDMLQRIIPEFVQQTSGIERKLCEDCLGSLTAVFEFRQICLENVNIFDEYVKKSQLGESHKNIAVKIAGIKLYIKKEINKEIISDEDTCLPENEVHPNFLEIYIKQENSYNIESNEEKEENHQKGDVLDIKKEISEEIILDKDTKRDVAPSDSYKSDTSKTDKQENQEVDCDERLQCTECGEEFHNRMRETDSPKCQKCQTISAPNKSGANLYSCGLCGKKFPRLAFVKVHHQQSHPNDKPRFLRIHNISDKRTFECDVCKKWFNADILKRHKIIHTGVRPFECKICQKRFSQRSHLTSHEWTHSRDRERPFQCNLCEKSFLLSKTLQSHIKTHSNEKQFECVICKKRFKGEYYLRMHKLLHTGQRPFQCDICEKTFAFSVTLTNHKRIHDNEKPYSCTICQKSFSKSSSLKRHELIHTGEKSFVCDVCPKKFSQATSLKVHKRFHDGIKSFDCGVCGKLFYTGSDRNRHVKTHHKENSDSAQVLGTQSANSI